MLIQICAEFSTLPDVRAIKAHEIRFFYERMRGTLKAHTAPKG